MDFNAGAAVLAGLIAGGIMIVPSYTGRAAAGVLSDLGARAE